VGAATRSMAWVAAALLALAVSPAQAAERIAWCVNLDLAWDLVQQDGRPLLVFVTRQGCKYCTKMKATYANEQVARQVNDRYIPVAVDAASAAALVKRFKIKSFPTTLVISSDARLVDRIQGYVAAEEMPRRLFMVQERYAALPTR
jgi:thioredoxin-related protein